MARKQYISRIVQMPVLRNAIFLLVAIFCSCQKSPDYLQKTTITSLEKQCCQQLIYSEDALTEPIVHLEKDKSLFWLSVQAAKPCGSNISEKVRVTDSAFVIELSVPQQESQTCFCSDAFRYEGTVPQSSGAMFIQVRIRQLDGTVFTRNIELQ